MSNVERNVEIMRDWFTAGVYGDVTEDRAESFVDAHYAAHGRAYGLGGAFVEGPELFKAFRKAFLGAFSQVKIEMIHCFGEGDLVCTHWEATMRSRKTGAPVSLKGGGVVRMENEQIVEAWNLINFVELLEQLGEVDKDAVMIAFETHKG